MGRRPSRLFCPNGSTITATTPPQFKILGVTIDATAATFYADRSTTLTSTAFFAQAVGKQVAVTGTGSGPLVASKVLVLPADDD